MKDDDGRFAWMMQFVVLGIAIADREKADAVMSGTWTWCNHPWAQTLAEAIKDKSIGSTMQALKAAGVTRKSDERVAEAVLRWAAEKDAAERRKTLLATVQGMNEQELLEILKCRSTSASSSAGSPGTPKCERSPAAANSAPPALPPKETDAKTSRQESGRTTPVSST